MSCSIVCWKDFEYEESDVRIFYEHDRSRRVADDVVRLGHRMEQGDVRLHGAFDAMAAVHVYGQREHEPGEDDRRRDEPRLALAYDGAVCLVHAFMILQPRTNYPLAARCKGDRGFRYRY